MEKIHARKESGEKGDWDLQLERAVRSSGVSTIPKLQRFDVEPKLELQQESVRRSSGNCRSAGARQRGQTEPLSPDSVASVGC